MMMMKDWMEDAKCRGHVEWFVPSENAAHPLATQRKAVQICKSCPVRAHCLDFALREPEWSLGVWAGLTREPMRKLIRQLREIISLPATAGVPRLLSLVAANPDLHVVEDTTFRLAVTGTDEDRDILVRRFNLPLVTIAALILLSTPAQLETLAYHCTIPLWMETAIQERINFTFGKRTRVLAR